IEALRPLRLQGTLRTPVHIFNAQRLVAGLVPYPWDRCNGKTALPAELLQCFQEQFGLRDAWHGCAGLYGSRREVTAAAQVVKETLGRVPNAGQVVLVNERRLRLGEWLARFLGWMGGGSVLTRRLEKVRALFQLLQGRPSESTLVGSRWRCRLTPGAK